MAGKGGGAWKVAYADFVTAMMAFFLVMWITAQSKQIKESIAKYFNDPFGGPSTRPGGSSFQRHSESGDAPYSRGKTRIGPGRGRGEGVTKRKVEEDPNVKDAHKPSLFTVHGGDRSHVGTVILFEETSAELNQNARARLEEVLPLMTGKPNKIEIRGHSTGRPLPPELPYRSTWELCYARCMAAMQFLREHGIDVDRIRLSQAGAYEPQIVEGDHQRLVENSRVEVYMLGEHVDDLRGTGRYRIDLTPRDPSPVEASGGGEHAPRAGPTPGH
jgi:chemotaxis protein MotB